MFRWDAFAWALVGAMAIQIAANFANDASDAKRGADPEDRQGPPRMVSLGAISPGRMWSAVGAAAAVATTAGVALTLIAGPLIPVIGIASILAMLGYVGGPFPYGYRGLGEVFVFLFFGVVATVGSRYVHDMTAPAAAWLLAIPVGLLATAILVANNYRDIETDRRVGKRTLAVIIGSAKTRTLFATLIYGAYPLIAVFAIVTWTPVETAFAALLLPYAAVPVRLLNAGDDGKTLIRALKSAAKLHLWTGIALAAGAALSL